jgi:hypothetical protein
MLQTGAALAFPPRLEPLVAGHRPIAEARTAALVFRLRFPVSFHFVIPGGELRLKLGDASTKASDLKIGRVISSFVITRLCPLSAGSFAARGPLLRSSWDISRQTWSRRHCVRLRLHCGHFRASVCSLGGRRAAFGR